MTASPDFRPASPDDLADIQALLESAGLPFEGLAAGSMHDFIVAYDARGQLFAAGGIEHHGEHGLLRSVVVDAKARGAGFGRGMIAALEGRARARGITALYLLTTTAAEFFPRMGYEKFDRTAVPATIAQSAEFAVLCPATAVCMKKNLE